MKILLTSLLLFTIPLIVNAWNDCPYGYVNSPYPGHCARYVDSDNDQICDHSQSPLGERTQEQPSSSKLEVNQPLNYYFWQIVILTLLFYAFTQYLILLSKETKIKWINGVTKQRVRRFLNYLLLISFLLSMITGLFRLFHIFGWIEVHPKWLYWHVEFSIIFTVLALVHILERWRDFFNRFKK